MKIDGVEINVVKYVGLVFLFIVLLMAGCPAYNLYSQKMEGKAELLKQEQTRKIQIEQARAEKESADLRAEAIRTIGQAAKDFPEYRLQEFIGAFAEALQNGNIQKIIYVPTEANIPITEASRLSIENTSESE